LSARGARAQSKDNSGSDQSGQHGRSGYRGTCHDVRPAVANQSAKRVCLLDSATRLCHVFWMKSTLVIVSIVALLAGAAEAASKPDKRKAKNASQNAAATGAVSSSASRRGANKSSGANSGADIYRYDPVGKD